MIKDAVGHRHPTSGGGPLHMAVKLSDGTYHNFKDMGKGCALDSLTHNLSSVSQLCDQGYIVIFKPNKAEIRTPDDIVIPLAKRGGLYSIEGKVP